MHVQSTIWAAKAYKKDSEQDRHSLLEASLHIISPSNTGKVSLSRYISPGCSKNARCIQTAQIESYPWPSLEVRGRLYVANLVVYKLVWQAIVVSISVARTSLVRIRLIYIVSIPTISRRNRILHACACSVYQAFLSVPLPLSKAWGRGYTANGLNVQLYGHAR